MSDDKAQMFYYYWNLYRGDIQDRPVPEYEFARSIHYVDAAGRKRTRGYAFDWAFPDSRVAVEVDGGQWSPGGGRHAKDADREKTNTAAALRWFVFHFSPDQLSADPKKCVNYVVQAIMDNL